MSKKIVAIFLLMIILFSNCALAIEEGLKYTREGGNNLYEVASTYKDKIYINNIEDYATSIRVNYTKVKIYNYNSNVEKKCTGETEIKYSQNKDKYYLSTSVFRDGKKEGQKLFGDGDQYLFYTIKLDSGAVNEKNIATFIYEDAIQFKGQTYDVKLNLKEINKIGAAETRARVLIACRNESTSNKYDITTYDQKFEPAIGMDKDGAYDKDYKAEISVEYFIVDKSGNEVKFNGMLEVSDLDQYQGLVINNFKATKDNSFIEKAFDTVKYKYIDSSNFFVYTTVPGNLDDERDTYYDYFLLNNRNKVDMVFTFDTVPAHSSILFNTDMMSTYKEVITEVVGGKITPSISYIKYGEDKTVEYSPNNPERQYIKSITVDGKNVDPNNYKDSYTFSNIKENHKITVVYADKYKVEYDAKGGKPTPETEYVDPNNTATKPADPVRDGYTFQGWVKPGETEVYDFNTPVTSDIKLEAKWQPNAPKSGIPYKVEHYKQTTNGEYKLALTENATGEENAKVTAKAKVFDGYKENTTHPERKAEGTVLADGSLVLKLYYDKVEYTVTFDPQNGNNIDDQKVKYEEKATEPDKQTKDGYRFEYWYYIDENGKEVKYNFDDPVTHDIDLIAKWEKISEPVKDDTTTDKTMPYTGRTMVYLNAVLSIIAGFVMVTVVRIKNNKPAFFRSL